MHENREISGASRLDKARDRSAKVQSHNAGMYVPEKSDRVVGTDEPAEQREDSPGGGWGGKGAGHGELRSVLHEPDTERENACSRD